MGKTSSLALLSELLIFENAPGVSGRSGNEEGLLCSREHLPAAGPMCSEGPFLPSCWVKHTQVTREAGWRPGAALGGSYQGCEEGSMGQEAMRRGLERG